MELKIFTTKILCRLIPTTICWVLLQPCRAQVPISPVDLKISNSKPVVGLLLPAASGFRTVIGKDRFYLQTGVGRYTSVDTEGQLQLACDISRIPPIEGVDPNSFYMVNLAPTTHGDLLALVKYAKDGEPDRMAVVRFKEDGEFDGLIWLNTPADFHATHVAELNLSHQFVANGYDDTGHVRFYIYSSGGREVLRNVNAERSVEPMGTEKSSLSHEESSDAAAQEAAFTQLASADDDSVYLLPGRSADRITRIEAGGAVSSTSLPSRKIGNMLPLQLLATHTLLYITFADMPSDKESIASHILSAFSTYVIDRYTGNILAVYKITKPYGALPLPISPTKFSFLSPSVEENRIVFSLVTGTP